MTPFTHQDALAAAHAQGLDRLDVQRLLLHVLARPGTDRAWLFSHGDDLLEPSAANAFSALVQRCAAGEPLAYVLGEQEFFGLPFTVDRRVLVPRPDTETLVDWALTLLLANNAAPHPRILDLGTGSGAIALALAHTLQARGKPAHITAVDASQDALAAATANARKLSLKVDFSASDWLAQVTGAFDLIVSNPPYISDGDPHLAQLTHEPLQALTAGPDGLDDLRRIIADAPAHLQVGGWLLLEHGHDQSEAVRALLEQRGFVDVQSRCDLPGIERCSGGRWDGTAG